MAPQVMPAGALVTDPVPVPTFVIVSVRLTIPAVNVAVTVVSAVRVTTHVPVPLHPPPDHPLKVEPASGVADSVTGVPFAKLVEQVAPQVIPVGALETEPVPVPTLETVRVRGISVNVAVTGVFEVSVMMHVPVPLQPPPDHPVNAEPASGVAVSVTTVSTANVAEQVGRR